MADMIYADDLRRAMEEAGALKYVKDEVVYKSAWGVPIVDAVEVVRCKDCKWIDLCKDPEYYEYKGANGFCSKGKRKDGVTE